MIIKALQFINLPLFRFDSVLVVFLFCCFGSNLKAQPNFFFTGPTATVAVDDVFEVAFRATNFVAVGGLQFSLNWDSTIVEFQNITPSFPTSSASFNTINASSGVVNGFWNDANVFTVPDTAQLFVVTFKGLTEGAVNLEFVNEPTATLVVYRLNEQVFEEPIIFGGDGGVCVGIKTNTFTSSLANSAVFYQNNPNPFTKTTYIPFKLTNSEFFTLKIFGITGEEIYQYSNRYDEGTHRIKINSEVFPNPGTYMYQVSTTSTSTIKKMILVR